MTAPGTEGMDISIGPGAPPPDNQVPYMYTSFKAQMTAIATDHKVNLNVDHNAEVIGSIVMAACTGNKELKPKDTYFLFMESASKTYEYKAVEINTSSVTQWASTNVQEGENKGRWYPFLALLQLASKTKDTILWQKTPVTQELGLSPSMEVYANGYNIKDRLKNSRPRSVGPLVHLLHLKRLSSGPQKNAKTRKNLDSQSVLGIKKSIAGHLRRQCIGETQKMMINRFESGDWAALSTFAASLLAIKPRIETHFVLPYALIAVCADFKDANLSGEWVYITLEKIAAAKLLYITGPNESWTLFMSQILIHSVFQSAGEDLGLLSWMFNMRFFQRREFGKFCKKSELRILGTFTFQYIVWSKPLKSAPRTVEGVRRGQISCRPSFKGRRASYNHFTSIESLQAGQSTSEKSLLEMVQEECTKYMNVPFEGTTDFYKKGTMEAVEVPADAVNGYLLLA